MTWTQHVMSCADAASITGEDVHDSCTVVLCEAQGEPGWVDGGICWASHALAGGVTDANGNVGTPADQRLNPSLDAQDWT